MATVSVGHVRQSIFPIVSNAAAILPAYWALRKKALAKWVLFTSSGISTGLYHACDVGTWCALSYNVLQVSTNGFELILDGLTFTLLMSVHGLLALFHGCD